MISSFDWKRGREKGRGLSKAAAYLDIAAGINLLLLRSRAIKSEA